MKPVHHLDDATLIRYAAGDLDPAFATIVASHLAVCDHCREQARNAEAIGGSLLESQTPVTLASDAFARLSKRLDEQPEAQIRTETPPIETSPSVPAPLARLIGHDLDAVPWRTVAPGVKRHMIMEQDGKSLYMLNIGPGKAVPEHGHGGSEMTLILRGAYRDGMGLFKQGDIADLDEHVEHQPVVEPGETCICLVATEAPTRFKGFFSRMLQPLIGI